MDWNLLIAITGIVLVGIVAFVIGFCAGTSFGRLEEHKALGSAFDKAIRGLGERLVEVEAREKAKTAKTA